MIIPALSQLRKEVIFYGVANIPGNSLQVIIDYLLESVVENISMLVKDHIVGISVLMVNHRIHFTIIEISFFFDINFSNYVIFDMIDLLMII